MYGIKGATLAEFYSIFVADIWNKSPTLVIKLWYERAKNIAWASLL